jgi:hypothetical protein
MWTHGFDMYRVYISTPGDLLPEQNACRAAMAQVNEAEAMPRKILLVSVGLREDGQIVGFRSAVSGNIRECSYFLQVFEDDWGPDRLHRKMFLLATECRDDESKPMREVVVCLKDAPHETDPAILEFRRELAEQPGVRVIRFDRPESLKQQLEDVLNGWVAEIVASGGGMPAAEAPGEAGE